MLAMFTIRIEQVKHRYAIHRMGESTIFGHDRIVLQGLFDTLFTINA